ncbi:hypothetical protein CIW49_16280 [Mycolicibacterium sp. P1-18]|uniref:hypothetical protein n=1 Tax=Mycolicibacterium sp. P1-18 TaxID=2024615 RepID=UPI0011F22679|nr:hypothetical protein [Mycolicibacterium sp. P1-18]KAA0097445.1 hypothetical protein CIW49_16280 [Mycolicibacterium sp. P1-18]
MTGAPELAGLADPHTGRDLRDVGAEWQARRLALSGLVASAAGIVATVPGAPAVQSLALVVLLAWGGGSAILCWVELPTGASVAGVVGLSVASVVVMATLMARFGAWYPKLACLCLSILVATSGLVRLWSSNGDVPTIVSIRPTPQRGGRLWALALLSSSVTVWVVALGPLRSNPGGDYGLLFTPGGGLLVLAMIAAVSSFAAAVAARRSMLAALAVLVSIGVGRVTSTLITDVPAYTWTYKHVGVVDYIVSHQALAPYWTDIYVRWPGFFTTMAWFSSVTSVDPVDVAHWFAPVVDALIAVVLGALVLTVTRSKQPALVGALLVQLVNWVAQDYYSPQALSLVMAFSILALLSCSNRYPMAGYLSVVVFIAMVWTHQLTPVWIISVVVALSVMRRVRPRSIAVYYLVVWVVYVFPRLDSVERYGLFSFDPVANAAGPTQSERLEAPGYQFTVLVDRGLATTFWALAAMCVLVLWRRRARPWAAAIVAFSPMVLIVSQSYGGEATMRVFLYSLAGCTLLVAPFLARALAASNPVWGRVRRSLAWVVLVFFALAGMQGYYSNWSFSTVTRQQLEQSQWLLATNQDRRGITVWAPLVGWPQRPSAAYVKYALVDPQYDIPLDDLRSSFLKDVPTAGVMEEVEEHVRNGRIPLYVVIPRQLEKYDAWLGVFKPGVLQGLATQMATRPGWSQVIADDDTVVYRYPEG